MAKKTPGKADGMSRHELYSVWAGMMNRCHNAGSRNYRNYGGRGIAVCPDWHSAKKFIEDMPPRPHPGLQIDRVDNDGNYEPGNVRWVTPKENNRNRRVTVRVEHGGKVLPLGEVVEKSGLEYHIIHSRVRRNDKDLFREAIRRRKNSLQHVTGVYPHKVTGKWEVSIRYKGKRTCMGYFDTYEEAVALRREFDQSSEEKKIEMMSREVARRKRSGPETVTGVYRHKKTRWQLSIKYNGRRKYMGSFKSYEEAAEVRRAFDRASEEQKEKIMNGDAT